ncbi:MAG TPA: hypothetical protein VL095_01035 [Flavisolibacter sp.]|nr:hypothetical protein [Flavisolibacter sp.]
MRKILAVLGFILAANAVFAQKNVASQKVDSIYFHLYTDSLKKGFYNYINVDGKLSNGTWTPLDSTQVLLISDAGFFKGNDLFIDSSYKEETVRVKAVLKSNPSVHKEVIIHIRKRGFTEPLKTNDEILNEMRQKSAKSKKKS